MNTLSSDQLLHTIPEARARLGNIGHSKFYQIVGSGQLKLVKIGRRSFVTSDELERYVNALSDESEAALLRQEGAAPAADESAEAAA